MGVSESVLRMLCPCREFVKALDHGCDSKCEIFRGCCTAQIEFSDDYSPGEPQRLPAESAADSKG